MNRFTSIVTNLHLVRLSMLAESRARRASRITKPKIIKKISFDSPELEAIFNGMPEDMRELIKKGGS